MFYCKLSDYRKINGYPVQATTRYVNKTIKHVYSILHPITGLMLEECANMREVHDWIESQKGFLK